MIIFDKNQWQLSGDLTIEKIPAIIDLINKQKLDKMAWLLLFQNLLRRMLALTKRPQINDRF